MGAILSSNPILDRTNKCDLKVPCFTKYRSPDVNLYGYFRVRSKVNEVFESPSKTRIRKQGKTVQTSPRPLFSREHESGGCTGAKMTQFLSDVP
mgnify:CR=1 FL=1